MLSYFLGILTGLIITVLVILTTIKLQPKIDRLIAQTSSQLKEKGRIFEPEEENEEVEDWINNLKEK